MRNKPSRRRATIAAGPFAALLLLGASTPAHAQIVTHHDTIPDFCASSTIRSATSGSWSNPATWTPARVPAANDVVIVSGGTTVTFDAFMSSPASCVGVSGALNFVTGSNTRLWASNVLVYASGSLQVGTATTPVPAAVTSEIVIANRALNTGSDPDQYGTGLIAVGKVRIHGTARTPTFVRLSQEPRAGNTTLALSQAAGGWAVGNRLVLPDTRHMRWDEVTNWAPTTPQWEELTVAAISSDGRTVTLSQPLRWDHLGARDGNGVLNFLPHVANLSRNVTVRSEVPIGGTGTLGHIMFTDRADVDIRYAAFKDLGRTTISPLNSATNHIGRYAIHFHHLMGPLATPANGYQYTFIGNAIDGGSTTNRLKWGMAVHNTHYGLIQGNVVYNWAGASISFEDGSESFNVVDGNFAMRTWGTGDRLAEGTEGSGFWFRGPNNYVRNNVAANLWGNTTEAAYGYKYFMRYLGTINIPVAKGSDTMVTGQYVARDGNKMPFLEISNNEVYSAAQGFTYWWVNAFGDPPNPSAAESVVSNLKIWHVYNKAVYHYPAAKITFNGLVIRGKDPANAACCGQGWHGEDYGASAIRIVNSDIQGMNIGVRPSTAGTGVQSVESSFLRNLTNVQMITLYSANGPGWLPARTTILRNDTFAAWPGSSLRIVNMNWSVTGQSNTTQRDEVYVYAVNGVASDNFRAYYSQQGTQNVAGGLAPCATTRSGVSGIACSIPAETNPPSPPPPPPPTPTPTGPPAAPTNLRIFP